jgi:RND family efflux transporter MFP subunit
MGGPVINIFVQEGSMVQKGQLMMQIDDQIIKKGLEELSTGISFAEDVFNRQKRLWEQKAGSEIQYLQAKNTYESLLKKKESLEQQLDNAKIYAPFSGYVDYIFPKIGETVMPGLPVFKLTDMSNIKVTADISEAYISTIKAGVTVEVSIPELNEVVTGKVTSASKSIDSRNRTFRAEIRLSRIPNNLRPFLVCSVSINDVTKSNIITAPIAYLQKNADNFYVYVVDEANGVAVKRELKTGLFNDTNAEILSGLNQGDKIITNGALDVSDGQKVKIVNSK